MNIETIKKANELLAKKRSMQDIVSELEVILKTHESLNSTQFLVDSYFSIALTRTAGVGSNKQRDSKSVYFTLEPGEVVPIILKCIIDLRECYQKYIVEIDKEIELL